MIIIYHSRDLDGYCSGAICKKKYPDATLIGYDYGQPIPWDKIPSGEAVIMADVSLPMVDMLIMAERSKRQFTWIDHHVSAIIDFNNTVIENNGLINTVLEDGIAACEGAWKYLFPNDPMPAAVQLLGKYDTWRNEDKEEWENDILPFQFGMRLNINSAENFDMSLLELNHLDKKPVLSIEKCLPIIQLGKGILTYQKSQNAIVMRGAFELNFHGYRAIACNGGGFNSQAFETVWDEAKYDLMMPFKYDGKKWVFSMYTTHNIDLSILTKQLGGGGHKKTCGFQMTELPEFLFNRNI